MFEVTFLGHQGWQLSAGGTNVLLDPLLAGGFGHDPRGNGFDVFPPRRIDASACPPIDAVMFSHEHEDHFNVATIESLDRRIPAYVSTHSSSAARRLLQELGFTVHRLRPGEAFDIGALSFLPLSQASLEGSHPGEWDALALHVGDRDGHGSFFTTVDHRPQIETFEILRRRGLRPALVAYADNEADHSAMFPWAAPRGDGDDSLVEELRELLKRSMPRDFRPQAILLCANGFAPRGEQAWMNRSVFHRDPRVACARLRPATDHLFVAPLPGETMIMNRGRRQPELGRSPWIAALEQSEWPARGGGERPTVPFGPATGTLRLDDSSRAALPAALGELARFLYASTLFREMVLLDADALAGRRATMAFVLLEGDDVESGHACPASVWVWDPTDCSFSNEPLERPEDELVAGARCWAADLLAVLEARMPAASLTMGRLAGWNAAPDALGFDLPNQLHMFCHPLRAPDRFLELYRGLLSGAEPLIRPRV
jgi:L-ascorbate metabolism protein UlaG (beta-lactamase superfamily)